MMTRLSVFALLTLSTITTVWADTVDDFTVVQGPLVVEPGQTLDEDLLVIEAPGVLGGFRTAVPSTGEDAAPGSNTGLVIVNGYFECNIEFPNVDAVNNNSGCAVGWDRGEGPVFDLTNAGSFEFEVLSVTGGLALAMTMVDTNLSSVIYPLEGPVEGPVSMALNEFLQIAPGPAFDLSSVDAISLTVINQEGDQGNIRIGAIETAGPIGGGPVVPVPPDVSVDNVSGTYYNPSRSGEGCQVTVEGDGATIILTCYLFQDGAQIWIIGAGGLANGEATFSMSLTSGADFGSAFDKDDVIRTTWGTAVLRWRDCNSADIELTPLLPGYAPITLETEKVTGSDCAGDGPPANVLASQGTLYDPDRDGEGFQLAVQGESEILVLTWYTYLAGEQVWLIGTGTQAGNTLVFDDMVITSGADFGADFDPDDVTRTPWGSLIFTFIDCNNAIAFVTPLASQTDYEQFEIPVRKLVQGNCTVQQAGLR